MMTFEWTWIVLAAATFAVLLMVAAFTIVFMRRKAGMEGDLVLFREAIATSSQGMVLFDAQERFHSANPAAEKYLPFLNDPANLPDTLKGFLNYFYDNAAEYDEVLANTLGKTSETQPVVGFREVITWGKGRYCLVEACKTGAGLTVLVLTDVSHSKKQEEDVLKLNEQNFELTQAIEASTNGVIITNPLLPSHPVVFANKAFCDHTGQSCSSVVGQSVHKIIHRISNEQSRNNLHKAIDDEKPADLEIEIEEKNVSRWFDFKLTPVRDRGDRAVMFIGVFTETTLLKQREAEFFRSQKLEALAQLAAGVSHDFNNVLSIMDGYVRLAETHMDEPDKLGDFLQRIALSIQRGANITKQMLTFGRHQVVSDAVIDLSEVVREQEVLLRPLLDASVTFVIRSEVENAYIQCSSDTIVQILMNLAVNARDAMPGGGSCLIEIRECTKAEIPVDLSRKIRPGEFIALYFSDTGTGMDKKTLERIFDPFFTTKAPGKGTGLGLSMVYGLVKQMNGYIDVRSSLGRGTTIVIYLPLSQEKPTKNISGNLQDAQSINMHGYTALVVEDEPDLLMLVSDMLEKLDMTVLRAENGGEALVVQDEYEGEIDLLLTDVVMPELNGVKTAELMESVRPGIKVIYMSGYPARGELARVEIPEDAAFLAKPVSYDDLAFVIYDLLRAKNDAQAEDISPSRTSPYWETVKGEHYG